MIESEPEVSEARHREILSLLRTLLSRGVHPTLRDAGLSVIEVQWLANREQILLGDTQPWGGREKSEFLDRYVIAELTDKALTWLERKESCEPPPPPVHQVQIVPPRESKSAKIFQWLGNRLWEIVVLILTGLFVVWFAWKHHWY